MIWKRNKRGRPKGSNNIRRTYNIHEDLEEKITNMAHQLYITKNSIVVTALRLGLNELEEKLINYDKKQIEKIIKN